MENNRIKKSLFFLLCTILFVGFVSLRFTHQIPKPQTATISSIPTSNQTNTQKRTPEKNQKELFPVERVIDGDTIVVNINDQSIHIRLIGINSPELNDKRPQVACFAKKAKDEAEKLLDGKNVYLEKDSTQGDYDKYGRLLAYVFLEDGTSFNKLMIEEGYAYEYTYRLPYKYQTEFKAAQQEARAAQRSLWSINTCRN